MSIILDAVRRVDTKLDRVHLLRTQRHAASTVQSQNVERSLRATQLESIIQTLSTSASSRPLLSAWRVCLLLDRAGLSEPAGSYAASEEATATYEEELEWLLVSKATVQTYGLLLSTLLEQTIPLNNDIWYWDEVLGSYTYSSLYTIQTSPARLWSWCEDIYRDTKRRIASLNDASSESVSASDLSTSLTDRWTRFYALVQESIQQRSVADIQRRVLSPIAICRTEAKHKQSKLRLLREMGASGIGVLMDEGLNFDVEDGEVSRAEKTNDDGNQEWKLILERSIALMDTVLCNITTLEVGVSDFEDAVFSSVENDPEISSLTTDLSQMARPGKQAKRLQHILQTLVPSHIEASKSLATKYGRPSRLVRYWLPASLLFLSSTTLLRILANRKADIITWVREFGSTLRDFWMNWVIEPTRKIIGTIRHDKDSEVAIMSKESLKGDRDSLERMVLDFAIDNPEAAQVGNGTLTEQQISDIRAKVKEGDLTPVLRAYEKDLRKPFVGTVRGDLVRTLLIQVQKTKVDVEVAISGIDALLKSQELVFGFVGLTPGVLVCVSIARYLGGSFGQRKGERKGRKAGRTIRVLRNLHRILSLATPTQGNTLSYKDHGLLLCEVHILRQRAHELFPGEVEREFLEDVGDLCNINSGIQQQLSVLERIRWSYSKWLR